ncbi:hypothetical protein CRG98_041353 [Punica granatum]|uniref:Aminotransferase-like plant mobile domain-containing protein n=1 Tax=Punica granatum TaxID=22663 RepID=A0A2I0I2N7_PUNGR|nr:hypothetical protein CRG98_041353 [Punica granatum]
MDRPAPGLRLEAITPPRQEIMRIWRTLRPVDRAFIQGIIGDVVMLTETPVDWIFLRTAAEFWDPQHAVFNFQGTELAPTIEEMRGSLHLLQVWLLAHIRPFCSSHPFSYIADERSLIERLVSVFPPPEHSFSEWRHFWGELTPARFLWVARWNPGGPMITGCPGIVGVLLLSHLGSTLIFPGRGSTSPQWSHTVPIPRVAPTSAPEAESSTQAAMRAKLQSIGEERDRLRCELVDSRAEVSDYRELQMELARARARIATLDREMARLKATLDRARARAPGAPHP